jgi:putative SOS response-associated peptidase YedK
VSILFLYAKIDYEGDIMCGRFTITVDLEDLRAYLSESFDIHDVSSDILVPRYNVAPGQMVVAVINDGKKNRVGLIKWGFIPSFAKDETMSFSMINAKSETLFEKPAYKDAVKHKRCVILADGFYEWMKDRDKKQPVRILMKDEKIFPMAGLWSTYERKDGTKLHTATILTTEANALISNIHDRMPVILTEKDKVKWLNPSIKEKTEIEKLMKPYPEDFMTYYPVSNLVNNAKNEDQKCIEKVLIQQDSTLF